MATVTLVSKKDSITQKEYRAFQHAYDFFNRELFGGTLPHVLVTLQRHAKARGYFSPERFIARVAEATAHELALNPDTFIGRSDEEVLSTLAHEMVHVWQQSWGTPPRKSYHDREWAAKMKEIGLQPTTTGEPGGKETGQSVTHYIIPGGAYARAYARLKAEGFQLNWQSAPIGKEAKAKKASKTKYTCPDCGQNAWAKPDAALICGDCYDEDGGEPCFMLAEQGEGES
jgi:predicted SprT family Zn-dependent metalloprotease